MTELPDIKAQLCKYVLWQHNNGTRQLSPRQIGSPWEWIFKTQQIMKDGETVLAYELKGVKVPQDGEHKAHTFMLNEIRL